MKICTVLGARPQFIKCAPMSRALAARQGIDEIIVHTGQHFDANMSDIFFTELDIPRPAYNLGISGLSHAAMTGRMMESLETTFQAENPDWVIVYGDTNSTIAGALAASKLHIPIAHVEAGLRSFNRAMPEEINRVLTDHCSDLLFAPTETAMRNLRVEGIPEAAMTLVGDVMQDAALLFGETAVRKSHVLADLGLDQHRFVLATVHRQENTADPRRLRAIVDGLTKVAREIPVILPLHPRTHASLESNGLAISSDVRVIEPLGYLDMLALEKKATAVVTDSGGVQKEAYFQRVPCITLRDETEWIELVESGWNRICPPLSSDGIAKEILDAIGTTGEDVALYGNGDASELIVERLLKA